MQSYGFTQVSEEKTVGDILSQKTGNIPDLVHVHPIDTVRDAVKIMAEYDISQLPVLTAEPPVVMGEVAGAVDERALLEDIFTGRAQMTDSIAKFVGAPLALIGVHESVSAARAALAGVDALLVTSDGKPAGVLTRQDLLTFLTA
jgi:cystathionine beta-synthase